MMIEQLMLVFSVVISVAGWVWVYYSTRQFNREAHENSARILLIDKYLVDGLSKETSKLRSGNYNLDKFSNTLEELKVFLSMYEPDKYKEEYNIVQDSINTLMSKLNNYKQTEDQISEENIQELINMTDECITNTHKFLLKDGIYTHESNS